MTEDRKQFVTSAFRLAEELVLHNTRIPDFMMAGIFHDVIMAALNEWPQYGNACATGAQIENDQLT